LQPAPATPLRDDTVVDISHEALIRLWKDLRLWIKDEADSADMLRRLVDAARAYTAEDGDLWGGRALRKVKGWRARERPGPEWVNLYYPGIGATTWQEATAFLDECSFEVTRARRRALLAAAAVVAMLAAIVYVVGVKGLKELHATKARELASSAQWEVDRHPARAAHLALAAIDLDSRNAVARQMLVQSLVNLEGARIERTERFDAALNDARLTSDGSRILAVAGTEARILDAKTLSPIRQIKLAEEAQAAWLVDGGTRIVTLGDGRAWIRDVEGEAKPTLLSCGGPHEAVYGVAVSPAEDRLALACQDGSIVVHEARSRGDPKFVYPRSEAGRSTQTALAFSGTGDLLAAGNADGIIRVWRIDGSSRPWIGPSLDAIGAWPFRHGAAVRSLSFHPRDPGRLLSAGDDGKTIAWSFGAGHPGQGGTVPTELARWEARAGRPITLAKFAPHLEDDDCLLAVADKRMVVWSARNPKNKQFRRHENWVTDANVSADGEWYVTGSADGTARLWAAQGSAPIAVLRGSEGLVLRAFFGEGNRIVTASTDGAVRLWRYGAPRVLAGGSPWKLGAAFDPEGRRIALGDESSLRILRIDPDGSGAVICEVSLKELGADLDQVSQISWSSDGSHLLAWATGIKVTAQPRAFVVRADCGGA
ncbi:MAG: hypothetical protein WCK58_18880, partial [Chloroflexota bacterium]